MITVTFDEVFSLENVLRAHYKGRLSKRKKRPIVRYEISLIEKLYKLYIAIHDGTYEVSEYNSFIVFEPKKREIQTLRYSDRIVQHIICDSVLAPYFTKRAIMDNCVCQIGKGTHYGLARFEKAMHAYIHKNGPKGYILRCDILKYFPSIPHAKLKELLHQHIKDKKLKDFICKIIDRHHTSPEYLAKFNIPLGKGAHEETKGNKKRYLTYRGIPIGNQSSQIFGMFYLNRLDRFIKEQLRIKIYSRYMDDFIIVHQDKKYLKYVLTQIEALVGDLGLRLNQKTKIFPIKNGLTYLGFRYQVNSNGRLIKKVSKGTIDRFRSRAKLLNRAYADGAVDEERIRNSLASYHGHLKYGDCYMLEQELFAKIKVAQIYQAKKQESQNSSC